MYKVRKQDMIKTFDQYETFNQFFTRKIKPRKIESGLISPADSKILSISKIKSDECLLIKKVNYKVGQFLTGQKGYEMSFPKRYTDSTMWSCIFYLAPGDYHRYHCPVDFVAKSRLHIPGKLAPVKQSSLKKGLYEGNERVVLEGEWEQGIMYLVFVGATNVGSMRINFDQELRTNTSKSFKSGYKHYSNLPVSEPYHSDIHGVHIKKGEEIGYFELGKDYVAMLGSTVVMLFETNNIAWQAKPQQKIRFGQTVASGQI